jgi:transcriptional regulator with XRE-family HTH domain
MKQNSIEQNILLKKLGLSIRRARQKKGLSQESLALAADLDRSYIGGVERGERNVAIINLKKIADALKISVSQLLKGL